MYTFIALYFYKIICYVNTCLFIDRVNYFYFCVKCFFIFIIYLGTVEVIAGEEGMVFESGPFSYFGKEAINCKHSSMYFWPVEFQPTS